MNTNAVIEHVDASYLDNDNVSDKKTFKLTKEEQYKPTQTDIDNSHQLQSLESHPPLLNEEKNLSRGFQRDSHILEHTVKNLNRGNVNHNVEHDSSTKESNWKRNSYRQQS